MSGVTHRLSVFHSYLHIDTLVWLSPLVAREPVLRKDSEPFLFFDRTILVLRLSVKENIHFYRAICLYHACVFRLSYYRSL
jgi:hypothetical protein